MSTEHESRETFARRLKELRREHKMSQKDLANMLEMSTGTVAMWETGKRYPSFEAFIKMEDIFDRKMDYIQGLSDDSTPSKWSEDQIDQLGIWQIEEDFTEVVLKYLRLDDRGKRAVEALINTEFSHCKSEGVLFPREDYIVSIRIKND